MSLRSLLTDWRVALLIVILLASVLAIAPKSADDGTTSLSYGLELDGGTRIQLSAQGKLVTTNGGVPTDPNATSDFENKISEKITERVSNASGNLTNGTNDIRVKVLAPNRRTASNTNPRLEIGANVSNDIIREVLESEGVRIDEIKSGVSDETISELRSTLETRLENAPQFGGLAGISVRTQTNLLTDETFVVIEIPGETNESSSIVDTLRTKGSFELRVETGQNESETVFSGNMIENARAPVRQRDDSYVVPFTMTDEGEETFQQKMRESGAASNPTEHQLIMIFNGQEISRNPLAGRFAQDIEQGTWQGGGVQVTGIENEGQGQRITAALRSGELPTDIEISSSTSVTAAQGEKFKTFSLLAGLFAVLTVGATIFWRYREIRIAVPMMLTGLAEVVAILGFAAAVNLNLDLSHIAGLIAVIGTGVDDLVIIADGVLEEGEIKSSTLYEKRFRKAFIIIAMAAVTTIGAMLPLAFLGLGRIQGFAIVTIFGVLVGIIITRPAYGSILRELLTEN